MELVEEELPIVVGIGTRTALSSSRSQQSLDSRRTLLRITPYRLVGTCFSVGAGVVVKVVACWDSKDGPFPFNTVDWVVGGAVGVL